MQLLTNRLGRVYGRIEDDGTVAYCCKVCDQWKTIDGFYVEGNGKRHSTCRKCNLQKQDDRRKRDPNATREYHQKYREANRDKCRESYRRHYLNGKKKRAIKARAQTPDGRAVRLVGQARKRAKLKYRQTAKGRSSRLVCSAKKQAATTGLPFDLTRDWCLARLSTGKCEITGISFIFELPGRIGDANPWSPSIDRIDPSKGYVQDNCRVVVWAFNRARGKWSDSELLSLAEAVIANRDRLRL